MKREYGPNALLRQESKDSLLVAARLGIPLGYALVGTAVVVNVVALVHPVMEYPPFPVAIVISLGLVAALAGLALAHRAVGRELAKRQDEPSDLREALLRVAVLVAIGLVLWLVLFYAVLFAVERLTTIPAEHAIEIAVGLPILLMIVCGGLFATRKNAS